MKFAYRDGPSEDLLLVSWPCNRFRYWGTFGYENADSSPVSASARKALSCFFSFAVSPRGFNASLPLPPPLSKNSIAASRDGKMPLCMYGPVFAISRSVGVLKAFQSFLSLVTRYLP